MAFVGRRRRSRRQRGLTLLELLIVLAITVILASAVSYAMMAEVSFQHLQETRRASADRTNATETEIRRLLQGAKFTPSTSTGTTATTTTLTSVATSTFFQGVNDGGQALAGCDRITFTTTAPGVPLASIYSTDDFQTQHDARGPVGGVSEVSIGTQPVGSPSAGQTGLFERVQTPSDTDPTQGGYESVLDPNIDQVGFEFWDGQEWATAWDTTNGQMSLPQAVRVSYTIKNEEGSPVHTFIAPIPASTIDAAHPSTSASSVSGSTGAGQ